jgi:hypothetical protein
MAVGQIVSGNPYPVAGQSKRGASFRIRLLSNIGLYPRGQIQGSKGVYFLDEQLAFIAVRTDEQRAHKYWSEVTLLAFEEIRFLSALLLSMRPDHGILQIYPGGAHITDGSSDATALYETAKRLALEFANDRLTTSIPLSGGASYRISDQRIDDTRYKTLVAKISVRDHLLLRGLSAILKADMLYVHREFGEEAQSLLFVAMEVAFQLTLRLIRESGVENPSALDAGQFLFSTFPNELPGRRFFEDYYDDRIRTFHPHSRFGTFAFPPMLAGDFYGLRAGLITMFQFLITKEQWYTLWT